MRSAAKPFSRRKHLRLARSGKAGNGLPAVFFCQRDQGAGTEAFRRRHERQVVALGFLLSDLHIRIFAIARVYEDSTLSLTNLLF